MPPRSGARSLRVRTWRPGITTRSIATPATGAESSACAGDAMKSTDASAAVSEIDRSRLVHMGVLCTRVSGETLEVFGGREALDELLRVGRSRRIDIAVYG